MNQQNASTSVEIAREAAVQTAEDPQAVGDFLRREDLGDGVYDFRFDSGLKGYEHWEWAVTLYHDAELGEWTVNEAALLPTKRSLVAPQWVPFRDRLPRRARGSRDSQEDDGQETEPGIAEAEAGQEMRDRDGNLLDPADSDEDVAEAINRFYLLRRRVPSPKGLQDTAQRWDDGRSHSSRGDSDCVRDAFVVPLEGILGRMYGVCTNRHCRYDGKVVPLDHTCADPDGIDDDALRGMWPENSPLVDSEHIDVFDDRHRSDSRSAADSDEDSEDDDSSDPAGQPDDSTLTIDSDDDQEEASTVSDPRHHKVVESIEDMSVPDDDDFDDEAGRSEDESLLDGGDDTDLKRARAIQQGFTRVRRRRRRH